MKKHKLNAATTAIALLATFASHSANAETSRERAYFIPSLGWYDAISPKQEAILIGAEYRYRPVWQDLRPVAGVLLTSDSAAYAYGGFAYDFRVANQWYVTPSAAAGLYHDGNGLDLGHTVEFRTGVELGYSFVDATRLSLGFHHLSNASLGHKNPGVETLTIGYHVPW